MRERVVRRQLRLRRTVTRLRGCLDGLPTLERRVLMLRSGLGPRRPRSRARVARALDVSTRRVARLERRGLRRLRGLARGGCGGGRTTDGGAAAPATGASSPPRTTVLASAPFEADRVEVKGEQESSSRPGSGGPEPERAPAAASPPNLPRAVLGGKGAGTDLTVPLLTLGALLAIAFASRGVIRSSEGR